MGIVGAFTLQEMQRSELLIAPAVKTEGKAFQIAQGLR